MNSADELKKLKELLDDGIIDEDDFNKKKAEILESSFGLETTKKEKQETNEAKEEIKKKEETLNQKEKELNEKEQLYKDELIKEKAKLDAEQLLKEEQKNKRKAKTKEVVSVGANKTKSILKWTMAVLLWLLGIGSFGAAGQSGLVYIPLGIIFIIQGCMLCPKITEITNKFEKYTKYKTAILWGTIILFIILAVLFPVKNVDTDNNNVNNETYQENNN